jgi:outer membrane protein TolC
MNTMTKLALLAAVALLAASCAVVERETDPVPVTRAAPTIPAYEPAESNAAPGWWTKLGDPVLDAAVTRALRNRSVEKPERDEHAVAVRVVRAYVSAAEGRRQAAIARALVETGSRTLSAVRERYSLGLCSSHDVNAASRDLTWANNLFRQRRQDLAHALRDLENLTGRRPSRTFLSTVRLPDLPDEAAADPHPAEGPEKDLRSLEERCSETLERTVEARRRVEEKLAGAGREGLPFLRAHRDELEAQSRWVAARKRRLDHRIDRLQAEADPEGEAVGKAGENADEVPFPRIPSILTIGGWALPRGK